MRCHLWKCTSLLALAGLASSAAAQHAPHYQIYRSRVPGQVIPPEYCPSPTPLQTPAPSTTPSTTMPSTPSPSTTQPTTTPTAASEPSPGAESGSQTTFYGGSIAAAGTGVSAAAQGAAAAAGSLLGFPQVPVVLPGLLTVANSQSALPMDRIAFSYSYLDSFKIFQSQIVSGQPLGTSNRTTGFNLNTYNIAIEKTLLDGKASVYAQIPFLDATENTTGQGIDGLGNVSFGFKYVLWCDDDGRNLFTGGFTVSAPTGRTVHYPIGFNPLSDGTEVFDGSNRIIPGSLTPSGFVRINPTYLQPWIAGQMVCDRIFIHDYFGVLIPTQDEVATYLNNNLTVGYMLYRSDSRDAMLRWVTPTVDLQALIPVSRRGEPNSSVPVAATPDPVTNVPVLPAPSFGFSDQFFVTGGAQFGLGDRAILSFGVVTPVAGPRAFATGYNIGLTYNY